jgi:hypothetical protein
VGLIILLVMVSQVVQHIYQQQHRQKFMVEYR